MRSQKKGYVVSMCCAEKVTSWLEISRPHRNFRREPHSKQLVWISVSSEQQLAKSIAQEFRDKVAINSLLTGICKEKHVVMQPLITRVRDASELVFLLIIRSAARQLNTGCSNMYFICVREHTRIIS